jgi:hypothetical protein
MPARTTSCPSTDLTGEQIVALLDLADELKAERAEQLGPGNRSARRRSGGAPSR